MYPMSRPINSPAWGLDPKKCLLWMLFKGPIFFFKVPKKFLLEGKGFFNGRVARCYSFFLAKLWLLGDFYSNWLNLSGKVHGKIPQGCKVCLPMLPNTPLWRPYLFMYGLLMRGALNWSISTQIRERRRQQLIQPSGCHRAPERHLDGSPDRSNEAGNPSGWH